jgi:hypothetical protein
MFITLLKESLEANDGSRRILPGNRLRYERIIFPVSFFKASSRIITSKLKSTFWENTPSKVLSKEALPSPNVAIAILSFTASIASIYRWSIYKKSMRDLEASYAHFERWVAEVKRIIKGL